MSWGFAHRWADLQRQLRLAGRLARYGRASYSGVACPARTAVLTTLFRTTNAYLRELGVEYGLAYGTLLGWYREGRILANDRDVDFGAPLAAFSAIWAGRARLPRGFTLYDTSHRHRGPKCYVNYRGWDADIYFYGEQDGHLQSLEASVNPGEVTPFPRDYFFPLQPAVFLGEKTFVPAQPERLLFHHYQYLGADGVRDPVTRYFRPRGNAGWTLDRSARSKER